jgi:hypothetical protein
MSTYLIPCFRRGVTEDGHIIAGKINFSGIDWCKGTKLLLNSASNGLTYSASINRDCPDGSASGSFSESYELTDTGTTTIATSLGADCFGMCMPIYTVNEYSYLGAQINNIGGNIHKIVDDCDANHAETNIGFNFISRLELGFGVPDFNGLSDLYYKAVVTGLTQESSMAIPLEGFDSNGSIDMTVNEFNFSIPLYNHFSPIDYNAGTFDGLYNFSASFNFSIVAC